MKISYKGYFIIVTLIPVIILLGMTIQPLLALFWGQEILLETEPIDPRDIFRGDYVRLNYKINQIEVSKGDQDLLQKIDSSESYQKLRNKTIYVAIKKVGDYYSVDFVSLSKPKNQLFITGKYRYNQIGLRDREDFMNVDYSLDRFFVPENTGRDLENLARKGQLVAKVKVFNGYSLLVDVVPQVSTKI